jgi:hypothetical protein
MQEGKIAFRVRGEDRGTFSCARDGAITNARSGSAATIDSVLDELKTLIRGSGHTERIAVHIWEDVMYVGGSAGFDRVAEFSDGGSVASLKMMTVDTFVSKVREKITAWIAQRDAVRITRDGVTLGWYVLKEGTGLMDGGVRLVTVDDVMGKLREVINTSNDTAAIEVSVFDTAPSYYIYEARDAGTGEVSASILRKEGSQMSTDALLAEVRGRLDARVNKAPPTPPVQSRMMAMLARLEAALL